MMSPTDGEMKFAIGMNGIILVDEAFRGCRKLSKTIQSVCSFGGLFFTLLRKASEFVLTLCK